MAVHHKSYSYCKADLKCMTTRQSFAHEAESACVILPCSLLKFSEVCSPVGVTLENVTASSFRQVYRYNRYAISLPPSVQHYVSWNMGS